MAGSALTVALLSILLAFIQVSDINLFADAGICASLCENFGTAGVCAAQSSGTAGGLTYAWNGCAINRWDVYACGLQCQIFGDCHSSFYQDCMKPTLISISKSSALLNDGTDKITITGRYFTLWDSTYATTYSPVFQLGGVPMTVVSNAKNYWPNWNKYSPFTQTALTPKYSLGLSEDFVVQVPAQAGGSAVNLVLWNALRASDTVTISCSFSPPSITSVSPSAMPTDGSVPITIYGANFGTNPIVTINGVSATITSKTYTTIIVPCPTGTGMGATITVAAGGQTTTTTYNYAAPLVTSISPSSGSTSGTGVITIYGANFGNNIAKISALFGGFWSCSSPSIVTSHASFQCTVPAGYGANVLVTVTVDSQVSQSSIYYDYNPPTVSAITYPLSGAALPTVGGTITITGTNFGPANSGAVSVTIGTTACSNVAVLTPHMSLSCLAAAGQGTGLYPTVQVGAQVNANTAVYVNYLAPVVTSISPWSGSTSGGYSIVVVGSNFGTSGKVYFRHSSDTGTGTECVSSLGPTHNHTRIACTAPPGQGNDLQVLVNVLGTISNLDKIFAYDAPALSSVVPANSATEGSVVQFIGTNLGTFGLAAIDSISCSLSVFSHTAVQCTVSPSSGSNLDARVEVPAGGRSSTLSGYFSFRSPSITSVNPGSVNTEGNVILTIFGSSFGSVPGSVTFVSASTSCPVQTGGWSHTAIMCSMPALSGSNSTFQVRSADGKVGYSSLLTFKAPNSMSATPTFFTTDTSQGPLLTITGSSFGTGGMTRVAGLPCAVRSYSHKRITCVPSNSTGANLNFTVTRTSSSPAASATVTGAISYYAPSITSLTPTTGCDTIGTTFITVDGTNFGPSSSSASVVVLSSALPITRVIPHRRFMFQCPVGSGKGIQVYAVVGGQYSGSAQLSYQAPVLMSVSPTLFSTSGNAIMALSGSNFGPSTAPVSVTIGGQYNCPVTAHTQTQINCTVPSGLGTQQLVSVNVDGLLSTQSVFVSYFGPTITSISAPSYPTLGGVSLTILGSNLGWYGTATVSGSVCANIFQNNTLVICWLPAGQGRDASVQVSVGAQKSNAITLSYDKPDISFVSGSTTSSSTAGGDIITVMGRNFGTNGYATIGGKLCTATQVVLNSAQITCAVPIGQGVDLDLIVNVDGQISAPVNFSYAAPLITSVSVLSSPDDLIPTDGTGVLVISGTSFGTSSVITLGGRSCDIVSGTQSHSRVRCTAPKNSGTNVTLVLDAGGQKDATLLSYRKPIITSLSPATADTAGGISLRLSGSEFGPYTGLARVEVGGKLCNATGAGFQQTAIECLLPGGVGLGIAVVVYNSAGESSSGGSRALSYSAPIINALAAPLSFTESKPANLLTVSGSNFGSSRDAATVSVAGATCPLVPGQHNDTSIVCYLPAGSGMSLPVSVNIGGQMSAPRPFAYAAPTITSVSGCADTDATTTSGCNILGGTTITVSGTNFAPESNVTVGGVPCTTVAYVYQNPGQILTCTLPAKATGGFALPVAVSVGPNQYLAQSVANNYLSYAGPTILPGTLLVQTASTTYGSSGTVTADWTLVGSRGLRAYFNCKNLIATPWVVVYGLPSSSVRFTCSDVRQLSLSNSIYTVSCALPDSVGSGLRFQITAGQQESLFGTDTLSHPAPLLVASSLGDTSSAVRSNLLQVNTTEGQTITFQAQHVGSRAGPLQVTYGPGPAYNQYSCKSISVTVIDTGTETAQITCRTVPGEGFNLRFIVTALNVPSDPSPFAYSYPRAPVVYKVEGCPKQSGNATSGCSTEGGTILTVTGANFASDVSTRISTSICLLKTFISSSKFTCQISEGAGISLQIVVSSGFLFSRGVRLFSYASPSITGVDGCVADAAAPGSIQNCSRSGGDRITVVGHDFRPPVTTYIGGLPCGNVVHDDAIQPYRAFSCTTPGGSGMQRTLLVIQNGGTVGTSTNVTISYEPCNPGQYVAGNACLWCPAGTTSTGLNAAVCESCVSGTVASESGSSSCTTCQPGRHAYNTTLCVDCELGRYSSATGVTSCDKCNLGMYAASTGTTKCQNCPAGTISANSLSACVPCEAGSYSPTPKSVACVQAPPGRYSATAGLSSSTDCPAGSYQDVSGQTGCKQCPMGSSQSAAGQASCPSCTDGQFSNTTGSTSCRTCPPGTYSSTGASFCTPCPPGSFNDAVGAATCTACVPGRYSSSTGNTMCTACAAGFQSQVSGSTSCSPCTPGYYTASPGLSSCTECPSGSFTSVFQSTNCTSCAAGRYSSGNAAVLCSDCKKGTSSPSIGQAQCRVCVPGTYSNTTQATTCLKCPPGHTSSAGSDGCVACRPGTYSPADGSYQCLTCPPGTYSNEIAAISCQPCPVNSYSSPGRSACNPCPDGMESPQTGAVACTNCPTGRYAVSGSSCVACPQGTYQSSPKQTSCMACPDGTLAPTVGSSFCTQCPAGRFNNGSLQLKDQCWPCASGSKQQFKGQSSCSLCAAGRATTETGATVCSACVPGRYASAPGQSTCGTCPAGTYSNTIGAQSCTNCSVGQSSMNGASGLSSCSDCDQGTYAPTEGTPLCVACPPGKYQGEVGSGSCRDCPVATFSSAYGSSQCSFCPPGSYSDSPGQSSCMLCPAGTFSLSGTSPSCTPCPPGRHSNNAGSTTCKSCEPGTFAEVAGLHDCLACPKGSYSAQTGLQSCSSCPIGTFNSNGGQASCSTCPLGRFSNTSGLQECYACPAGRTSSDSSQCADCSPGTFAGEGYPICSSCPAGRAQPLSAQSECDLCPLGYEAPSERSTQCSICASGRYAGSTGTIVCSQCPAGTFRNQNSPSGSQCDRCPPGSSQNLVGQTSCDLCVPGLFSPDYGTKTCLKCPAGRFSHSTNTTSCDTCPPGSYQDGQAMNPTNCTVCPPGTYSSTPESASCTPCSAGTFSASYNSTSCSQCPIGYEQANIGETGCVPCRPGWYSDERGSICKACKSGQIAIGSASTTCTDCPSGTFALGSNSSVCTPCAPGTFSARVDLPIQTCSRCPKGRYADASGQRTCVDCDPGRYADDEGLTSCKPCPIGTHQKGNGSMTCEACPAGYYQERLGQESCIACPPGRYSSDPVAGFGVAQCSTCVPGTFSGAAAVQCLQCPVRQVTTKPGESQCRACDVNSVANAFNSECLCNVGYYSDERDDPSTQCQVCGEGMSCRETGLTVETLEADPGYWKPTNTSVKFYRCILQKNCQGGVASICQANHNGPLCAVCNPGYYGTLRGDCSVCPSTSDSWTYFLMIGTAVLLVLWAQFFIVLRAGASKMQHVKAQDAVEKNERFWSDVIGVGLTQSESRHAVHESEQARLKASQAEEAAIHGQPTPKPNFSYKLKIMLGFTQILTSLMTIVETPMPNTFKEFVGIFAVMNLDVFSSSGLECVFNSNFYKKFLFVSFSPLILLILVILLYLLPKMVFGRSIDAASRKRSRKKFWRMLVFSLFLIYPNVSSTIVRLFVCTKVEGVYYLRSDMRIQCYDDTYQKYAGLGAFFALLYPIGIPCFFFVMLWRYRFRLQEDGVKAELGFLYDAYDHEIWWFELVDMVHKLGLTGLVAFFPATSQLIAAAVISVSYTILLLLVRPYIRKGDDRLHLFAQVEIFCAVVCGYIFKTDFTTNKSVDIGLSILLIVTVGTFSAFFFVQAAGVIFKIVKLKRHRRRRKLENKLQVNAMKLSDDENESDLQNSASPSQRTVPELSFSQRSFYKLGNDN